MKASLIVLLFISLTVCSLASAFEVMVPANDAKSGS